MEVLGFVGWNDSCFRDLVLDVVRWHREVRFAIILRSFEIVTHSEDTFLLELGHDWLSNELIEIIIIDF